MELKEKVIDAVIEEFNDKGLKFTMDDLAKRLGISKRTLYTVVRDKETLFVEAVDCIFNAIKKSERVIIENNSLDIVEKLKQVIIVIPQKYQTIDYRQLYELKRTYPRIYAKIEHRLETDWEPTYQIMEEAIAKGRMRPVLFPVFKAVISGTIEYYISRTELIESNITYEEALHQLLELLFDGLLIKKEEKHGTAHQLE